MALEETTKEEHDVKKRPASEEAVESDAKRAKTGDGEEQASGTRENEENRNIRKRWRGMHGVRRLTVCWLCCHRPESVTFSLSDMPLSSLIHSAPTGRRLCGSCSYYNVLSTATATTASSHGTIAARDDFRTVEST